MGLYAKKLPLPTDQEHVERRSKVLANLLKELQKWWQGVDASIFHPPAGFESCDGSVWALLELGETLLQKHAVHGPLLMVMPVLHVRIHSYV